MDKSGSHVLIVSADANKWHTNKVNFVKLYLEGITYTNRQNYNRQTMGFSSGPQNMGRFQASIFGRIQTKKFKIQINDEAAIKTSGPYRIRRVIFLRNVGSL